MKRHVVVLMGGDSTEREISLISGKAVAAALEDAGFAVSVLDPSEEDILTLPDRKPDAVFIALHGKGGEDGSLQGLLEWMHIPYTGPDVTASALCLNKILTKQVLVSNQIPTPAFSVLAKNEAAPCDVVEKAIEALGLPLVMKACRQGSSIGTIIARTREEALAAPALLFSYGDDILLEKYLSGKEISVPVLGNDSPTPLPVIEIVSQGEFYDYESKYAPGGSHHIIPARLEEDVAREAAETACRAFLATQCRGYARVDMMLSAEGKAMVIEINTAPGMTPTSLFPDAARSAGISFSELVKKMVLLALNEEK